MRWEETIHPNKKPDPRMSKAQADLELVHLSFPSIHIKEANRNYNFNGLEIWISC